MAGDGSIYSSGIVRFSFADGHYGEPVELSPPQTGEWPYVSPDGTLLIYAQGLPRSLMVSFRQPDGSWSTPRSLSDGFGFEDAEMNGMPYLTPDGRYLFFSARHDIYWVDSDVLRRLRPGGGS